MTFVKRCGLTLALVLALPILGACTGPSDAPSEAPPSDVESSVGDQNRAIVACMQARGWEDVTADGQGVTIDHPSDQDDVVSQDLYECSEEAGVDMSVPEVSQEEGERLYDALLELAECVEDEGFPVEEPPSREFFVAGLTEHPIPVWHPYDDMAVDDLDSVHRACPAPDTW